MKVGVLAHAIGHAVALEAALTDGAERGVEAWVSLGDMVGVFPEWRDCLRLMDGFAVTIRGRMENACIRGHGRSGGPVYEGMKRTIAELTDDDRARFATWPTATVFGGYRFEGNALDGTEQVPDAVSPFQISRGPLGTTCRTKENSGLGYVPETGCRPLQLTGGNELHPGQLVYGATFWESGYSRLPGHRHAPTYLIVSAEEVEFVTMPEITVIWPADLCKSASENQPPREPRRWWPFA